jgi:hypothetical protein
VMSVSSGMAVMLAQNPSLAEYRIDLMLYRARPFDNDGPAPYLVRAKPRWRNW